MTEANGFSLRYCSLIRLGLQVHTLDIGAASSTLPTGLQRLLRMTTRRFDEVQRSLQGMHWPAPRCGCGAVNNQAQAALLKDLLEIAAQSSNAHPALGHRGMSWSWGDDVLTLSEPVAYAFLSLVGRLARQSPWSERVSEDYIRERLVPILRRAREKGADSIEALLDELVTEVETYSVERIAYVPVAGLSLSVDGLEIGSVVLKTVDDEVVEELGRLFAPIHADADDSTQHRESVEASQREFAENLRGKVCAMFRTVAEATRAKERAREETRRILELVTYANAALHPFDHQADAVAGLEGEIPTVGPWIAVVSTEGLHHFVSRASTSWPIRLTPAVLERYEDIGFWALSDLLARPARELTDLDRTLLRAVHWFAASQAQAELENRLLNLITCLEALVGPKDRAPISTSVAEAVALIVARGYENRRGVKKFIGELYGARSGISHGGKKAVAESDVLELRWIVSTLITTLVRWKNGVRTRDELLEWLERARLSGEAMDPPAVDKAKPLRELRENRGWTQEELAGRVGRVSIDAAAVDRFEQRRPAPAIELRLFADALGVRPEEIALPPSERWVVVRGHRFHLTAHREEPGRWIARTSGWDPTDAVEWPRGAVDPEYPDIDSPSIIVTGHWEAAGFIADMALNALAGRIVAAMELALASAERSDYSTDSQPPKRGMGAERVDVD
jgi:transcriptional regulator with XRE-family HTH domain